MMFWDRLKATLRADAHGVIDAIEDRALVLKQHLRDAELELIRKRGTLSTLERERVRLLKDRERITQEQARFDRDAELALLEGKDELARHALQRLLPLERLQTRIADRLSAIADEQRALETNIAEQDAALTELRTKVDAFLAEQAEGSGAAPAFVPRPVEPEQVELELLRRKRAQREQPIEERDHEKR